MKNLVKRIKQVVARIKLRYSRMDDGIYLFFERDEGSKEDNIVTITSSVMQTYILKKRDMGSGEFVDTYTTRTEDRQCVIIAFPKSWDYIIYIPKAAFVTDIDVSNSTILNPLSDFGMMTSLHTLNIANTTVFGNLKEMQNCPFLNEIKFSVTQHISGYNNKRVLGMLPRNINLVKVSKECEKKK